MFDSDNLNTGETFIHTFETTGTYDYICELHPTQMRGEIIVINSDDN
ncbi:hypothetical protein GF312_20140 [Candidatus Poribacteria bacterium]|nr:hypothetical protein [Candidatus Poribacteria bacterium]